MASRGTAIDRGGSSAALEPPMVLESDRPTWPYGVGDVIAAGLTAALVSGAPSTLDAVRRRRDPLEASLAAGSLLFRGETRTPRLLAAAALVHTAISVSWAAVLALVLPRRRTGIAGALAGFVIAAFDLGVVGHRIAAIRRLRFLPQLADHVMFGFVVGTTLAARGDRSIADVAATRWIAVPPEDVFAFLSDLRNHWLLEDRFVELRALRSGAHEQTGGQVRLKGPLRLDREAKTRVLAASPPTPTNAGRLAGTAEIGRKTVGAVQWQIASHATGGSQVTLTATVVRASLPDRVLLLAGRWWLQRTFEQALANLDRIMCDRCADELSAGFPAVQDQWTVEALS